MEQRAAGAGADGAAEAPVRGDHVVRERSRGGAVPEDGAPPGQLLGDAGGQAAAAAQVRRAAR